METSEEFRTATDEAPSEPDLDAPAGPDVSGADEADPGDIDTDAHADVAPADDEAPEAPSGDDAAEGDSSVVDEASAAFDALEGGSLEEPDEESGSADGLQVVEVVGVVEDEETGEVEAVEVVEMLVDESTGEVEAAEVVEMTVDETTGEVEEVDVVEMARDDSTGEMEVVDAFAVTADEAESEEEAEAEAEEEAEAETDEPIEAVVEAGEAVETEAEAEESAEAEEGLDATAAAAEPEADEPEAATPKAAAEAAPAEDGAPKARDPFGGPGDWYVVHTYAGYENKVKANLLSRIHSMQMEDKIFNVHIPMEDVLEIKGGKRQVVQRKVFPGYLLVKMFYDNDSWYVVRNTPGVTGFVSSGTGTKPTPLSKREVEKILAVKQETEAKPAFRLEFEEGDTVRIVSGPFADFNGTVSEINVDQSKLKVLVSIFDRETPVELGFDQVAKV